MSTKDKSFSCTEVSDFLVGSHEEKGRRPTMEDAVIYADLDSRGNLKSKSKLNRICFFGVYDGHGGSQTSKELRTSLHVAVGEELKKVIADYISIDDNEKSNNIIKNCLKTSFLSIDSRVCSERHNSGSTATTALILGDRIFAANVGDSRVVLCRGGIAVPMSEDHKPSRPDEKARIAKSGGFVMNGRVLGELAVSRAFGDKRFKDLEEIADMLKDDDDENEMIVQPLVSPEPDFCVETLQENDEFLLLACDGLFDVMSNQQAIDFIRNELDRHGNPSQAAQATTKHAVSVKGSSDNVSIVIVKIKDINSSIVQQDGKNNNITTTSSSSTTDVAVAAAEENPASSISS